MGVFDIETVGLGGAFIIACACTEIGQYEIFSSMEDLLVWLLSNKGYIFYAHNGAKFDFLYMANLIKALRYDYDIQVTRQGEKIIGFTLEAKTDKQERLAKAKKHKGEHTQFSRSCGPLAIQIRDSLPLLNNSLFNATKSFAPEYIKLKGDIDFENGEIFSPLNEKHMLYLYRDCDGLLATMRKFYEVTYEMFSVYPSWTAGGTAMKAWKLTLNEGETYSENKSRVKENFIREAYYGGYVFPGNNTHHHTLVKSVDFNAAYAASMLEGVPYGDGEWTGHFIPEQKGFYEVLVTSPDIPPIFPCIPKHTHNGLLWPLGKFRTFCSTEEIHYASNKGYTFEIIKGLTFEETCFPFTNFVNMCQIFETTLDPLTGKVDPARKNVAKQYRNSLYGKFCMKRTMESIIISDEIPDGASFFLDKSGMPVEDIFTIMQENDADYLIPQWGAYITISQRLRLFKGMDSVETPFYCDTDSIKAPAHLVDKALASGVLEVHPTKYGCVKDEGTFDWFQVLAPKTYHGSIIDINTNRESDTYGYYTVHHEMKAKGAPARELAKAHTCPLCEASQGIYKKIAFTSMHSLERTLRNPLDSLNEERTRRISNIENSYAWSIDKEGNITPQTLHEFE